MDAILRGHKVARGKYLTNMQQTTIPQRCSNGPDVLCKYDEKPTAFNLL